MKFTTKKNKNNYERRCHLKTRRWGSVPHSGFGLGFDRLVTFVCRLQKIHDSIPFPISY